MSTFSALLPEALVLAAAVAVLARSRFAPVRQRGAAPIWTVSLGPPAAALLMLAWLLELSFGGALANLFHGGFLQDRFALFAKSFVLLGAAILIGLSDSEADQDADFQVGMSLLAVFGAMVAASAGTLIGLWAGGELAALSALIAATAGHGGQRTAAGVRLLVAGALAGGLIAIGFAYLYATAGVSGLNLIAAHLPAGYPTGPLTVAIVLAMAGLSIRLGLAPFQSTAMEAARDADPAGAGLLAGLGAGAAAIVLIKLAAATATVAAGWSNYLIIAAALAILGGGAGALGARSPRALIGWLGLAQAGWLAAAVATHSGLGLASAIFLLGAYVVAAAAAPALIGDSALRGLAAGSPVKGAAFALAVLSLAGVPPFAGWFGEFTVAVELMRAGLGWLVAAGLLGGVLAAFAAARAVWIVFLGAPPDETRPAAIGASALAAALAAAVVVAGYGLFANPFHQLAVQGAEALGLTR